MKGTAARAGLVLMTMCGGAVVPAAPAVAERPAVEQFDVAFPEGGCSGLDVLAELQVRITDKERPDGTVHHWVDISGTLTSAADVVTLQAHRRFTDDPQAGTARFAGLQSRFASAGEGTLTLNAGWARGALTDDIWAYALRGRWDGGSDVLPPSVCAALAD